MRILIAPDKFKGTLTAYEACLAMQRGVWAAFPDWETDLQPLSDGGEGVLEVLLESRGGYRVVVPTVDPLLRPILAEMGFSADGETALIEMAQASGLQLLAPNERNPWHTSTLGTGKFLQIAQQRGAKRIVMGIGGSATHDAGLGVAVALGWTFLDESGVPLSPVGASLGRIQYVLPPDQQFPLPVVVACDVGNPLLGENGAAQVYAPQKGATPALVEQLEVGTENWARRMSALGRVDVPVDLRSFAGGGAAGGLGAGLVAYLGATLCAGSELLLSETGLSARIAASDLVLTGEGQLDAQTLHGKTIYGLLQLAGKKPVAALCGRVLLSPTQIQNAGLVAARSLGTTPKSASEMRAQAAVQLAKTTEAFIRQWASVEGRI